MKNGRENKQDQSKTGVIGNGKQQKVFGKFTGRVAVNLEIKKGIEQNYNSPDSDEKQLLSCRVQVKEGKVGSWKKQWQ